MGSPLPERAMHGPRSPLRFPAPVGLCLWLLACQPDKTPEETGSQETGGGETGAPDSGETGPGDTGSTGETDESGETGETGETGDPSPVDADGDGYDSTADCDDADATRYPGADELCDDGVVNDCDGDPIAAWEACGAHGRRSITTADLRVQGKAASQFLGIGVSDPGDLDGDGLSELAIAASANSDAASFAGAVHVFLGSNLAALSGTIDSSSADLTVTGVQAWEQIGAPLGRADDIDGDGLRELLIGAPAHAETAAYDGALYVLSGADMLYALGSTISVDASTHTLLAAHSADYAGGAFTSTADLDGDGLAEVWVGAPYEGTDTRLRGGSVYWMGGGGVMADSEGEHSLSDAELTISQDSPEAYFGSVVTRAGDLDGDGLEDLWVGDPIATRDIGYQGAARLYLGDALVAGGEAYAAEDNDMAVWGEFTFSAMGASFAALDLDGDGLDDTAIGASGEGISATEPGQVLLLLSGGTLAGTSGEIYSSATDAQISGVDAVDKLGQSMAVVGDVDVDGRSDLIIGSTNEACGALSGAAWLALGGGLLDGASGALDIADADAQYCGTASARTAIASGGPGDINGDGADDVVVPSWSESSTYSYAGEVSIFWGGGW